MFSYLTFSSILLLMEYLLSAYARLVYVSAYHQSYQISFHMICMCNTEKDPHLNSVINCSTALYHLLYTPTIPYCNIVDKNLQYQTNLITETAIKSKICQTTAAAPLQQTVVAAGYHLLIMQTDFCKKHKNMYFRE